MPNTERNLYNSSYRGFDEEEEHLAGMANGCFSAVKAFLSNLFNISLYSPPNPCSFLRFIYWIAERASWYSDTGYGSLKSSVTSVC